MSPLAVVLVAIAALFVLGGALAGTWVLLSMPARSEITRIEPAEESLSDTAEEQSAATIADEAARVKAAIEGEGRAWSRTIDSVKVVARLRRPVIEIVAAVDPEDADGAEALTAELRTLVEATSQDQAGGPTYYIQVLTREGDVVAVIADTDERWVLDTPPPPTDAPSLQGWLSEVYGPGAPEPEPWYARITGIRAPAEDPDGYVVVETDLDPAVRGDIVQAQWIIDAIDSSGATFAPAVRVRFGTSDFEWSSLIDGVDPFAP